MIEGALFAEDSGHSEFVGPLIERIASELGVDLQMTTRNSAGGKPQALRTLRNYSHDMRDGRVGFVEFLVVALDSDCASFATKKAEVEKAVGDYAGTLVVVVPEPHVERWYLLDPLAPAKAVGKVGGVAAPDKQCERYRYKGQLREAFRGLGIDPPAGGILYGGDIAREMDLTAARLFSSDFDRFVDDVQAGLTALSQ